MKTRRHHGRGQPGSVSVAFEAIRASLQTKLSLAIQHHQAGRPGEAEPLYLEILATNPRHPDALHLLGVIAHQTGRLDLALTLLEGAVAAEPRMAEFHNDLGTALRDRERLDESAACFQRALALRPDLVPARINLGTILQARGRLDEAVVCYQAAIQLAPDSPEAHNNLGAALYGLGHLEKAIASYRCAVALRPAYATALANLATLYSERGDLPEAESCCRRALALRHDMPGVHGELGKVLGSMGRSDEAVVCYQTVIQLAPDSPEAHNTLAAALWGLGRLDEAIASYRCAVALRPEYAEVANLAMLLRVRGDFAEAEGCCRRALALRPDLAEIHNELGTVLASMHRLDEAVKSLRQAVALRPEDGSLHHQLGAALAGVSRIAEAAASYDRALVLRRSPRSLVSRALLLPVVSESGAAMLAARAQFAAGVETLIRSDLTFTSSELGMAPPAFLLAYHGLDDRALQERVAAFYLGACPSLAWTAPHCTRGTRRAGRLRVGFVSTLLQNSTIGVLTRRLIAKLDRDRFEVIVFHGGTWDGMAVAIGESADRAQPLSAALDVAQQQIAAAELDIVFYPDIGMMARTYFLAFARLAPVQCVTWGHPVTTGIPTLDYFVSSEMLEPDGAEAHYAEDLVRLPRLPACYDRPAPATVSVDRARLGLRAGRLYVCPQSLFKLHPDFDGVLGEILDRDGDGRLILIEGDSSHWGELWRARFARGHPQLAPRVDFLPRLNQADFRALLETADVVLDPMHFGGGNSTYEALGLGVPVVTWPGSFMRGRVTHGCYRQMGVMDCVVADPSAYAARAVELATTPDLRAHVSARLRERADALFEDGAAVRALEDFFERAAGIGS